MQAPFYDHIIIGSSPIALCSAIRSLESGNSTLLIEKETQIGGAWKNHCLKAGVTTEMACHLIEYYRGGYELLERFSGVRFQKLKHQPIKCFTNGTQTNYISVKLIIKEFTRTAALYAASCLIQFFNAIVPARFEVLKLRQTNPDYWRPKLAFQYKYRIRGIFGFQGTKAPIGGYNAFTEALSQRFTQGGGIIINDEALEVEYMEPNWQLTLRKSDPIQTLQISATESVHLGKIILPNQTFILRGNYSTYWHVLVSVCSSHVCKGVSYVHLPDNQNFHRITKIDANIQDRTLFLIQLRLPFDQQTNLLLSIRLLLTELSVVIEESDLKEEARFQEPLMRSTQDNPIPKQLRESGITWLPSIGDLAKNICIFNENMETL